MIGFLLAVFLIHGAGVATAQQKLGLRYFYDKNNEELALQDVRFLTNQRGIAIGILNKDGRNNGVQLSTSDGGVNWTMEPLKDLPRNMFFLDDSLGWMITQGGIWQSEESGRSWKKIKSQKNLLDIHFLDAQRGFAVGAEKTALRTIDGGKKWTPIPEAEKLETKPDHSVFSVIAFATPRQGIIAGHYMAPRNHRGRGLPDWMEPEEARRHQVPTTLLDLETHDAGETWKSDKSSIFGRPSHLVLNAQDRGFVVFQFDYYFPWRSEVFRFAGKGRTERAYREKGQRVTDVLLQKNGTAYLAAVEAPGEIPGIPVPGRVIILKSVAEPYTLWERIPVDYRASAGNVRLTETPDGEIWAVTDMGMILSLK